MIDIKAILSAVDRTGPAFASAIRGMGELSTQARRVSGVLAGLFGAVSVGGVVAFAKSSIDAADAINDMSQRTGVAVRTLAEYQLAARQADTTMEALAAGIQRLTLSIGQAERGSAEQAEALRRLGVTARDPQQAFEQLADAVARSGDRVSTNADLMRVLGKSFGELLPLLQGGSQGLRDSAIASESFANSVVRLAPEAAKLNDQLDLFRTNAAGAAAAILSRLVPAINQAVEHVGLLRQLFAQGDFFGTVGLAFGARDTEEIVRRVRAEIETTEAALGRAQRRAAAGFRFGVDVASHEARLRALNAQLETLEAHRARAAQEPAARPPVVPRAIALPADTARAAARRAAASAAETAARREAEALLKAQQELERNRREAEAQGLADSLDARRQLLDQRRRAELIDEETAIRARAALGEEALRNELAALQAQQAQLRAAATAPGVRPVDRTQALAELVLVEARIGSAGERILNLTQQTTAELAELDAARLRAQSDFIAGLELEARLAGLNNDERETALLLLEAERLGISDINRLLELQGRIRRAATETAAAAEIQRQQEDLYRSVQQGVQRAFADGLNALGGDGTFRGALLGVVDTIRSALSNVLAAGLTESFLGMLGGRGGVMGLAGTLGLGGKNDGSTPASAIYVRDVAAGALAGGADAGGMLAGLFEGVRGFLANLADGLSGLLSGLAGGLSGLFGGGGGGGGAGGLLGALASGFAAGGYTGPGGKHQPAGIVHAGEFVFDAASTRRLGVGVLENMRRIASGQIVSARPRLSYADGGVVNLPGAAAPVFNNSTRIINHVNLEAAMSDYLATRGGERAILNIIQRNPGAMPA